MPATTTLPFLWRFYTSHRPTLFRIWRAITMPPPARTRRGRMRSGSSWRMDSRSEWLPLTGEHEATTTLDLSWVPDTWWRLVTGQHQRDAPPRRVNRQSLGSLLFSQLMRDLKSGDALHRGECRVRRLSWTVGQLGRIQRMAPAYREQVALPVAGDAFVAHLRTWLDAIARATDQSFPDNECLRIENGAPVLTKLPRKGEPAKLRWLGKIIANRSSRSRHP